MGTAVSMLDDLPALVPVLKDLGAKHVKYGVKDAHCEYAKLLYHQQAMSDEAMVCHPTPHPALW